MSFFGMLLKLLGSKSAMGNARFLLDSLSKSPEWQKDIVRLEAKIRRRDRELAQSFGQAIEEKMDARHERALLENFLSTYYELVDNGFGHGCVDDDDSITIKFVHFRLGVTIEVINDNLKTVIPETALTPPQSRNPSIGQGLRRILRTVDRCELTHGGRGIKAVIHSERTSFDFSNENVSLINISGFSFDITHQLKHALDGRDGDIIIIFGRHIAASARIRGTSYIQDKTLVEGQNDPNSALKTFIGRFAVVVERESDGKEITQILKDKVTRFVGCFNSAEEALLALQGPNEPEKTKTAQAFRDGERPGKARPPKKAKTKLVRPTNDTTES